jgi:hypothetical protein
MEIVMSSFPFQTPDPADTVFLSGDDPRWCPSIFNSVVLGAASKSDFYAAVNDLTAKALELGGVEAMLSPKPQAALHEAGHGVFFAAIGIEVSSVSIFRHSKPKQQALAAALGVAVELWGGTTRAQGLLKSDPYSSPEEDLLFVRTLISGWCGEWAHDARAMREGSSLDEIVMARMAIANAARKTGGPGQALFAKQIDVVVGILRANRRAHEGLAARLMCKSTIGPDALKRFLKDIRAAASNCRSQPTFTHSESGHHA